MTDRESPFASRSKFFTVHTDRHGATTMLAHRDEGEAREAHEQALRNGWPQTRKSAVYAADSMEQLEAHLTKRVRLVCVGTGDGYWDSPEGIAQREQDIDVTGDDDFGI